MTAPPAAGLEYARLSGGGVFHAHTTAPLGRAYPMKGGQGDYQPATVLMVWSTETGTAWQLQHVVITGQQIDARTGQPGQWPTSQTLYLGDERYAECEPEWLPELVAQNAPAGAS